MRPRLGWQQNFGSGKASLRTTYGGGPLEEEMQTRAPGSCNKYSDGGGIVFKKQKCIHTRPVCLSKRRLPSVLEDLYQTLKIPRSLLWGTSPRGRGKGVPHKAGVADERPPKDRGEWTGAYKYDRQGEGSSPQIASVLQERGASRFPQ